MGIVITTTCPLSHLAWLNPTDTSRFCPLSRRCGSVRILHGTAIPYVFFHLYSASVAYLHFARGYRIIHSFSVMLLPTRTSSMSYVRPLKQYGVLITTSYGHQLLCMHTWQGPGTVTARIITTKWISHEYAESPIWCYS